MSLPPEIDPTASLPAHQLARALAVMAAAHTDLVSTVHELAHRHGVHAAARLLGVSAMTVSRWRHGDTPGRQALDQARHTVDAAVSPRDDR